MIPKTAFIALALIMVSAWAFGIFCDRMITRWHKSLTEPSEDADHDRWEEDPEPTRRCDTCKHDGLTWYDEPCNECTGDKWEKAE